MNDKDPKQLYTISYSIIPKTSPEEVARRCLQELAEELLNVQMEEEGFPEANELIARIKAQL